MSYHMTTFQGSIPAAIEQAIKEKINDAVVEVQGGGGHFEISVTSKVFAGKSTLEKHRIVLGAIAHLMAGNDAPVHAVDKLNTKVPT
ncbi:BolA/IbaG family iron-sulfur metabolism protein [Polyangium sp. y55x31]|uniref:BolA/IbaG family iron-sulfur metabolism protein n=1 Tax=Polyangium sp. y55x31 TaxID=3042688 RepID=UPI00248276DA|nr:BolA/IbaG family iron-sulfur metabolism protein [Polyangium sp. y55x31]MDI1475497.1 BolA/IbaG family iron-sulfur metabolism protein [Polyangium sp. y55x31]